VVFLCRKPNISRRYFIGVLKMFARAIKLDQEVVKYIPQLKWSGGGAYYFHCDETVYVIKRHDNPIVSVASNSERNLVEPTGDQQVGLTQLMLIYKYNRNWRNFSYSCLAKASHFPLQIDVLALLTNELNVCSCNTMFHNFYPPSHPDFRSTLTAPVDVRGAP
jgi:hypothetical protein